MFHAGRINQRAVGLDVRVDSVGLRTHANQSPVRVQGSRRNRGERKSERRRIACPNRKKRRNRIALLERRRYQSGRVLAHTVVFAERNPVMVKTETAPHQGLAITIGVESKSNAGAPVVVQSARISLFHRFDRSVRHPRIQVAPGAQENIPFLPRFRIRMRIAVIIPTDSKR